MAKRKGKQINVWLPTRLVEAFTESAKTERRSITAELSIAMEERLKKLGRWSNDLLEESEGDKPEE